MNTEKDDTGRDVVIGTPDAALDAPEPPTIYEVLAGRARRTPDGRLVLDTAAGAVALAALAFLSAAWWLLLMPMVALGAYGLWGIADRELDAGLTTGPSATPSAGRTRALVLVKRTAAVLGTAAAAVTAALVLKVALGRLIS